MNKNILIIVLIIILVFLQIFLMPIFSIFSSYPNLILIAVILLILLDYEKGAFLMAGLGGLLLDFFSPIFFGFITLFLIFLVFLLRYLVKKVFPHINTLVVAGVTFISAIILNLFILFFLKEQLSVIFLILCGIYNSILAVVVFMFFNLQHGKLKLIKVSDK